MAPMVGDAGEHGLARAGGQNLHALVAAGDANDDGLQAETAGGAFQPGASRPGRASERGGRASAERVEPVARAREPALEQPRLQARGAASQSQAVSARVGE